MTVATQEKIISPVPAVKRKKKAGPFKMIERWAGYSLIKLIQCAVAILPGRGTSWLGAVLGNIYFMASRRDRETALCNLAMVYPDMPKKERYRLAKRVLINFGKSAAEFLRIPMMSDKEFWSRIRLNGQQHLDAALAKNKGVILLTAHFGNWEMWASAMSRQDYPVDAIARDPELPATANLLRHLREKYTIKRMYPKTNIKPVIRALKSNRIVAILADQHDFNGLLIQFLGHDALAASGPAAFAIMSGAPVVPLFCFRDKDDITNGYVYPELPIQLTGDKAHDIQTLTQQMNDFIGERVLEAPDQWLWSHDRWRPHTSWKLRKQTEVSSEHEERTES